MFRSLTLVTALDRASGGVPPRPARFGGVLLGLDGTFLSTWDFVVCPRHLHESPSLYSEYDKHGLTFDDIKAGYPMEDLEALLLALKASGVWMSSWLPPVEQEMLDRLDLRWATAIAHAVAWTPKWPTLTQACDYYKVPHEQFDMNLAVDRAELAARVLLEWSAGKAKRHGNDAQPAADEECVA